MMIWFQERDIDSFTKNIGFERASVTQLGQLKPLHVVRRADKSKGVRLDRESCCGDEVSAMATQVESCVALVNTLAHQLISLILHENENDAHSPLYS
jgi:hypothetical protein